MDVEKALDGDEKHDIILVDGDVFSIPTYNYTIDVMGAVRLPGLVQYRPGRKARYYAEALGGFCQRGYSQGTHRKGQRPGDEGDSSLLVRSRGAAWRHHRGSGEGAGQAAVAATTGHGVCRWGGVDQCGLVRGQLTGRRSAGD